MPSCIARVLPDGCARSSVSSTRAVGRRSAGAWRLLGETAGRGREDRSNAAALGRKRVYVYELAPDWRRRLGVGVGVALASDPLVPGDGLENGSWAENEFAGATPGSAPGWSRRPH